jgi:hypothetical protein
VVGDTVRLQQVLWNLLKNASKFTPEGGEIPVTSRNETSLILVEIPDTGIGIEPEALSTIFNAFNQGSEGIAPRVWKTGSWSGDFEGDRLRPMAARCVPRARSCKGSKFILGLPL